MPTITTTVTVMDGGAATIAAVPADTEVSVTGNWNTGDTWSFILTDELSGVQTLIGAGNASGQAPTFALTYGNRVHTLAGADDFFSAVGTATTFNSLTASGDSFVQFSDYFSTPNDMVSMSVYQGYLAFFARWSIQIWQQNADPLQWAQIQVLSNIGTIAAKSVQSLGDLDVMFLSDTGLRSLRARETTLNAFVSDIGSPVDLPVQADILAAGAGVVAACAVVEPLSGRYWCFVNDTLYVLSYYPNNKIVAWATYACTYQNGANQQVAFVPTDMVVFQGQVWLRAGNQSFLYGGTRGGVYDNCIAITATDWMDLKSPGTLKQFESVDVAVTGTWQVNGGTDQLNETNFPVIQTNRATYQLGKVNMTGQGWHFKVVAKTTGATAAKLSAIRVGWKEKNEK